MLIQIFEVTNQNLQGLSINQSESRPVKFEYQPRGASTEFDFHEQQQKASQYTRKNDCFC